ncbi:hypothetical protein [Clostridium cochlearium]|uniref:hypothetical protein n=1 Tax=Clostridium cochlearium TaxID=1494 RepID=UPI0022E76E35|nr:hypothetical protein [Clostridium cochlearium]
MARKNFRMKKTITMKRFISELGQNFSDKVKSRLLELEIRTVLTRKEVENILDIKHVEHTKYDCPTASKKGSTKGQKEFCYGRFIVIDNDLYFAETCIENESVMKCEIVDTIYNSLTSQQTVYEDISAKKIDDSNIDYVIDTLLSACPEVSQRYKEIMKEVISRSEDKLSHTL